MTNTEKPNMAAEANAGTNVVPLPTTPEPDTRSAVSQFVHDHPVAVIAGGLAVGALAAALLPKRNRRYVTKKASILAEAISAASMALAHDALGKAEKAGGTMRKQADVVSGRIERLGEEAVGRAERLGGYAAGKAQRFIPALQPKPRTFSEKLAEKAHDLRKQLPR